MVKSIQLLGLLLICSVTAYSQVIYNDIEPDLVADYTVDNENDTVRIDIDGDNVFDVEFIAGVSVVANEPLQGIIMHVYDTHLVAADVYSDTILNIPVSFNQTLVFNGGDYISWGENYETNSVLGEADGLALFITSPLITAGHATSNDVDFYIGLKINIFGFWHHAWVMLNLNSTIPKVTVKSFAYNTVAGAGIYAGATNTITESSPLQHITLNNPFGNSLELSSLPFNTKIFVYNIDGKLMTSFVSEQTVQSINTAKWSTGAYILKAVNEGEERFTQILKID